MGRRRHPLAEQLPSEVLAVWKAVADDLPTLRRAADALPEHDPVKVAADAYLDRHRWVSARPEEYGKTFVVGTADRIAAFRCFLDGAADMVLDDDSPIPVELQLRRQVCLSWMKQDAVNLRAGRSVYEPFMGTCAEDHIAQRKEFQASSKDADEFNDLRHFLPHYFQKTGRLLTQVSKGDPAKNEPDFILRDAHDGSEVGVEVTVAVAGWRKHRSRCFWEVVDDLYAPLATYQGTVLIYDRQYERDNDVRWDLIARNPRYRQTFVEKVSDAALTGLGRQSREKTFWIDVDAAPGLSGILISVDRRKGEFVPLLGTGQYGWSGDNPERMAVDDLVQSIKNKVDNPRPYQTPYTILLVAPITYTAVTNYQKVIHRGLEDVQAAASLTDRFQEVWISRPSDAWSIKPPVAL